MSCGVQSAGSALYRSGSAALNEKLKIPYFSSISDYKKLIFFLRPIRLYRCIRLLLDRSLLRAFIFPVSTLAFLFTYANVTKVPVRVSQQLN